MESDFLQEQNYIRAKKRVKEIKGFYIHLMVYIVINIMISGVIVYGLMMIVLAVMVVQLFEEMRN